MKKVLAIIGILLVTGCEKKAEIYHGYTFNDVVKLEENISLFKTKKSTKKEIENFLGSPSFKEIDGDNESFFYVEDIFNKGIIIHTKKSYSRILRIDFYKGKVKNAEIYKIDQDLMFDETLKTQIKGNTMGVLEQIEKNFTSLNSKKVLD